MGPKQAFAISSQRRGLGRVAVFLFALAIVVSGCGRSGHEAVTDSDKAADVEVLNTVLSQELTTVAAYEQALVQLRGGTLAVAGQLRGQDQVHLDAITKANSKRRGLRIAKKPCCSPTKRRTRRWARHLTQCRT